PSQMPKEEPKPAQPPLVQLNGFLAAAKIDRNDPSWRTHLPPPPVLTFDDKRYYWNLTTNVGDLKVLLHGKLVPGHCSSVIYLTTLGYYDGLKLHRDVKDFMVQGGDPLGNGAGNPGYRINLEVTPKLKHDKRGVVSTARTNDPNSAGSQFFVMFKA